MYWGLVDVELLALASGAAGEFDSAVLHVLVPLSVGPELMREARAGAVRLLQAELPALGYRLKYLDEFKYFDEVQWQSDEEAAFYLDLCARAGQTKQVQVGREHPYSSVGEEE